MTEEIVPQPITIETRRPRPLLGYSGDELRQIMAARGHNSFRGTQLAKWLYAKGATSFDQMTDIPRPLRNELAADAYIIGRSTVAVAQHSRDGTAKLLLELQDGQRVETVGLPYEGWLSCCVSSQVGCPVRCGFCATGRSGYTRNLTPGEIVDQVLTVHQVMQQRRGGEQRVDHVVFMGMGEPLLNYDNVLKAVHLLNKEVGIGMRNITISTVGYVPAIKKLAEEKLQVTLAISLHATNDTLRHRLIPTMTQWSVQDIVDAAREYANATSRRVTFEYCLLRDQNDSIVHAQELARLLRGVMAHVNLIPYNAVDGLGFLPPLADHVKAFRSILEQAGFEVTQRAQRGADIDAACGQLRRRQDQSTLTKT
ncbi:MAG: 23S rRNA (adenine(2503)-C(2))-methyltransferase RlmN [Dehalococcoidia bacterium]|nr:23S rRNA (adenine(2503)-C(2))-methyltransferase RlmN [Dehalococcoidia bacterium]